MITKQELSTIQNKAPLLSEGNISPFQVSRMSKRIKAEWEKNKQLRYKAEEEFKEQIKQEVIKELFNNFEPESYICDELGGLIYKTYRKKQVEEMLNKLWEKLKGK